MNGKPLVERYLVHGVRVQIETVSAPLAEALDARLRYFRAEFAGEPDLRCEYHSVPDAEWETVTGAPTAGYRTILAVPTLEMRYHPEADRLVTCYHGRMVSTWIPAERRAHVRFCESEAGSTWRLSHPMFTLPLVDCLKRHGRYCLHAASLGLHGKGLLFPAASGSGKSTLTLVLARAGFDFLSDDASFLHQDTGELRMLPFPEEVDVTDETLGWFPELSHRLAEPPRPDWRKRQVCVTDYFPTRVPEECVPAAIVFPQVAGTDSTTLERVPEEAAFFELASNLVATEPVSSQRHFDLIGKLVRQVPCYRMHTGRNLAELPKLLGELLA